MTAHDDAVKAIQSHEFPWLRVDNRRIASVIAAVPDNVLIDLLVERGVLSPVTLPHGNHTISVYQRRDVDMSEDFKPGLAGASADLCVRCRHHRVRHKSGRCSMCSQSCPEFVETT